MRLESNLTMFIHHKDGELVIGDLDFMIDNKMKKFVLNKDKSISPSSKPGFVIGVCPDDPL